MNFGVYAIKHGEPKENYNIISYTIDLAITFGLFYSGGFFDK